MNPNNDLEDTILAAKKVIYRLKKVTEERDTVIEYSLDVTIRLFLMHKYWKNFATMFFWYFCSTRSEIPALAFFCWTGAVYFFSLGVIGTGKRAIFEDRKDTMTTREKLDYANRLIK